MSNCPNVNVSTQTNATCWFHSIINPIVLSKRLRPFLYKSIADYINIHIKDKSHLEDWLKFQAPSCVSPNRPYTRIFAMKKLWAILFYRTKRNFTTNRNKKWASEHNIRNLIGAESRVGELSALSFANPNTHINRVLERIGFLNYAVLNSNKNIVFEKGSPRKDFIVVLTPQTPQDAISFQNNNFILDSGSIGLFGNKDVFPGASGDHASHAISGFKCGSEFYILDSNMETPYKCDWRNSNNIKNDPAYKKATSNKYGYMGNPNTKWNEVFYVFCIYVNANSGNKSFTNYSNDIYRISPVQLRRRLGQNQTTRNNLARETNKSLRQEKANAEAGERISASMKANANAREAAARKVRQANANARARALNETERRNAARRARQTAEKLKMNENAIKQMMRKGKMPVNPVNLNSWMNAQRQTPVQKPANLLNLNNGQNLISIYNSAKNFVRFVKSKNFAKMSAPERRIKIMESLRPLFNNPNTANSKNIASSIASRLRLIKNANDRINGTRFSTINNSWRTSRNVIERLVYAMHKHKPMNL